MSNPDVWHQELSKLETRAYNTYKARLEASKRLESRSRAVNGLVVALTLSALISAAGMLRDREIYGPNGDAIWLYISILTFAGSLTSSSMGYAARSRNMFQNYRKIQRLSVRAESAKSDPAQFTREAFEKLSSEYNDLLDESENHTTADYLRARSQFAPGTRPSKAERLRVFASDALSWIPWLAVLVPVALVVPAVMAFWP
ncbi:SLATT domain-containing protein [Micromonospora echinofusca]|uniref:SLATT domain-containing protein n=1 Tax=Micromonospora echinofusca TaxID=47858 RepID=A0ABS3VN14_MICEH|nr:SLATT domain-containing protein [Micromonospora echinofusca]